MQILGTVIIFQNQNILHKIVSVSYNIHILFIFLCLSKLFRVDQTYNAEKFYSIFNRFDSKDILFYSMWNGIFIYLFIHLRTQSSIKFVK